MLSTKPWWDTIDIIATKIVGDICKYQPDLIEKVNISNFEI